jgi:20S proteasome subunit beta 4
MDSTIALIGNGFGITMMDTLVYKSIFINKFDLNKYIQLGKNKFMSVSGYPGDIIQFTDFVQKTLQLYSLKTGCILSTHSVANCMRKELSDCLRKNPLKINLILMGFDKFLGSSLYFLDSYGTLQRLNYCAQGHCAVISGSILDRYFKKNLSVSEAIKILVKCINVLKTRFLLNQTFFLLKIVDAKGCRCIGIF